MHQKRLGTTGLVETHWTTFNGRKRFLEKNAKFAKGNISGEVDVIHVASSAKEMNEFKKLT